MKNNDKLNNNRYVKVISVFKRCTQKRDCHVQLREGSTVKKEKAVLGYRVIIT